MQPHDFFQKGVQDAEFALKSKGQTDIVLSIQDRMMMEDSSKDWNDEQWREYKLGYYSVFDF